MATIRLATTNDAAELAGFAEAIFRDTFGAMNNSDDVDAHCRRYYGAVIQVNEITDPAWTTMLVEEDGELVGYLQLRWRPAPASVIAERPGEIQRFYLRADWHGRGLAQEMMTRALNEMKDRGTDVAWLGVWEHNPRAISFYTKCGFRSVGDQPFILGDDTQRDIIMMREI